MKKHADPYKGIKYTKQDVRQALCHDIARIADALGQIAARLDVIDGHLSVMSFAMGSETELSLPAAAPQTPEPFPFPGGKLDLSDLDGQDAAE